MAGKGYISKSELDARRSRDTAFQQVQAAKANTDEGINGDRVEQRQQYAAALRAAEENLLQIRAQSDDLQVKAPVDGEVGPIPAEVGELLNAGSPLVTLIRVPDAYFVFNLREDIRPRAQRRQGQTAGAGAEGQNDRHRSALHRAAGDYATKRATRATGDFDLKTFEVRLYPSQPVDGLRPGMSTLWQWKEWGRLALLQSRVRQRVSRRLSQPGGALAELDLSADPVCADQQQLLRRHAARSAGLGGG